MVSRMVSTPRSPSVDEGTTIKVTVKNEGQGGSGSFIVTLNIAGPNGVLDESNRRVDVLAAGVSRTMEFPWTARAGSHTLTATVDSRWTIAETDESNNVLEETVVTALSDLEVTEVLLDNPNPSAGDDVEVGVRIENTGSGDSGRVNVGLFVDGEDEPYGIARIGSLEPNTSVYVDFRWRALEGCHRLFAVVDVAADAPEEDEGNNRSQQVEMCVGESR